MSTKIMIVDDHGVVRDGLQLLLEQDEDMEIVAQAPDGRQAVKMAAKVFPDVILMDVSMPGLNGIEATAQIIKENPQIKVLALSAHSNKRFVTDILKSGAHGYLLKDCITDELFRAIDAVKNGERYLCSKVAGVIIDNYIDGQGQGAGRASINSLTAKERELLQLLVEGLCTKEIARMLHLSIKTVDGRRRDIMNKLEMNSLAELTKFAIREGVTNLDF
jgi:DNA-binding NarL/FixJ family response regulator